MLIRGDARFLPLAETCVDCVVTSPPYWGLRDYGHGDQIGLEATPDAYVGHLVAVFREVRRVLKDRGTVWLNLGDSYAGGGNNRGNNSPLFAKQASNRGAVGQCADHAKNMRDIEGMKPKDLVGIPWRVAFALQADGWYLRSDIIWHKPNPMPESVTDRPTKSHEYLFLLSKQERYHYDADAIAEPIAESQVGRVRDDVFGGASWVERGQHSEGGRYVTGGTRRANRVDWHSQADLDSQDRGDCGRMADRPSGAGLPFVERGCDEREQERSLNLRDRARLDPQHFGAAGDASEGGFREFGLNGGLDQSHALLLTGASGVELNGDFQRDAIAGRGEIGHRQTIQPAVFNSKRNKRSVWTVTTESYSGAHFATMPEALIEPCILAGCPLGGLVLDPFVGSGTVVAVAERLGRRAVGVDLSYQDLAAERTAQRGLRFDGIELAEPIPSSVRTDRSGLPLENEKI